MVTPSLVIVGAPNFFSITTLRPRGPRVTRTALASLSTPASRPSRASLRKLSFFAISPSSSAVTSARRRRPPGAPPTGVRPGLRKRALLLLAGLGGDLRQHVAAREDQHVFALDAD